MLDIFELIRQKCPDGVPHVRIGDVAVVSAGYGFPKKYQGCTNGFPFYKVDDMNNAENGFMMRAAENYVTDDVLSKIGGKTCRSGTIIFPKIGAAVGTDKKRMLMEDAVFDNNVMGITADMQQLDDKFLLYWLSTIPLMSFVIGDGTIPSIRKTAVEDRLIPLPPLQVQRETVAILDKFDMYCNDMTAGLAGELEMRRKQYRYWRDKIFQDLLDEGCETRKLKDATLVDKFKQVSADVLKAMNTGSGNVRLLPSSANYDWYCEMTDDITGVVSEGNVITLGRARYPHIKYHSGKFVASQSHIIQSVDESILLPEYLYCFLEMSAQSFYTTDSSYPLFTRGDFNKTLIPVPDMARQREIVGILDKFRKLEHELEHELELRRKQYEYYRDLLLSFPEIKESA